MWSELIPIVEIWFFPPENLFPYGSSIFSIVVNVGILNPSQAAVTLGFAERGLDFATQWADYDVALMYNSRGSTISSIFSQAVFASGFRALNFFTLAFVFAWI